MGVGGAMDLVVGAERLIITMMPTRPNGDSKIVPALHVPLTARGVVDVVVDGAGGVPLDADA